MNLAVRLLPFALVLLFAAQCAWFIATQSLTADEPFHLHAGQEGWRHGQFKELDDNPPLARLWLTLLLRAPEYQIVKPPGGPVQALLPSPEEFLWRARGMNVLLGMALAAVFWRVLRRLYSVGTANFGLALFALSPSLVTHFSLATLDAPVALLIFVAVWQVARWRDNPSRLQTVVLGLVLGAMLVTKHNATAMFALALPMVLMLKPQSWRLNPRQWNWRSAMLVTFVVAVVVWGAYFFHVSQVTLGDGQMTVTFPNWNEPSLIGIPRGIHATFYLPAAEYFTGIFHVARNSRHGFESYLLGESYFRGKAIYFPLVVWFKWPTLILLLGVAGGALLLAKKVARPALLNVMLLFPALYFALAVMSNMNFGDRHILPVYPFLLLLATAVWEYARSRRARALKAALVVLLVLQAGDTARYAPDYLTYFNPFVAPAESYKLLSDSNLDWGQGVLALREYERAHPGEKIYFAYFGNANPQGVYGIRATPLHDGEYRSGTVVVGARHLSGYTHKDRWNYHWVEEYPRKAILGHVLHVFEVPEGAGPRRNASSPGQPGAAGDTPPKKDE